MAWDDDLADDQADIASERSTPVRLVAGPGTGKTRVMTRRIAWLIEEEGVEPGEILGVTFSRAAARELRERLMLLLGEDGARQVAVYTLHAFALRQLLRNQGAPNLPRPITIADDFDERWIIQEELRTLTGARRVKDIREELQSLASDWETLAADEDEWAQQHPNPRFLGAWRAHREIYGYTLRAELVYSVKKGLEQDPNFELEEDFRHVVVDEYQDLNRCEIEVVRALAERGPELFAAGDDDQSIYGFRNAFPLGLREFSQTYAGTTERELATCHRCDSEILALGLRVAEQDVDRIEKDLGPRPNAPDGEVRAFRFDSIAAEARGITQLCSQLIKGGLAASDILILLRNDPQGVYSIPIINALARAGVSAEVRSDPFSILGDGEGRMIVLLLRLLQSRADSLAWRELIELRDNRIGTSTLFAVYRLAEERGERYARTLQEIAKDPDLLGGKLRNRLRDEVVAIGELLDGFEGVLEEVAPTGVGRLIDSFDEDLEDVRDFLLSLVEDDPEARLRDVAQAIQSSRGSFDEAEREAGDDKVQILSMHSAKGLTAAAVIVAACEDELIPGGAEGKRAIDDERRLLYVSLTRAEHFLYITYAARRAGRQSQILQVPENRTLTQFLRDYVRPERL